MLLCLKEEPKQVVYRASITRYETHSATQLVGYVEEWVKQGASVTSGALVTTFDLNCPVRISDIDEPVCHSTSTTYPNSSNNLLIILAVIAVLFVTTTLLMGIISTD